MSSHRQVVKTDFDPRSDPFEIADDEAMDSELSRPEQALVLVREHRKSSQIRWLLALSDTSECDPACACDLNFSIGRLDNALDETKARGWIGVSMMEDL